MMVCGIVLGKANTTKVGMVWYELNIVNESINESVTKVGIELLGQLKNQYNVKCVREIYFCQLLDGGTTLWSGTTRSMEMSR